MEREITFSLTSLKGKKRLLLLHVDIGFDVSFSKGGVFSENINDTET